MLIHSPAVASDGLLIARQLRSADQREVITVTGGQDPERCLPDIVSLSLKSYAAHAEGSLDCPVLLYGVARSPLGDDYGMVWLVATEEMSKYRIDFFKAVPRILNDLSEGFRYLHCLADSRNTLHTRWLELIGFNRTSSHQVNGVTFHHYNWIK